MYGDCVFCKIVKGEIPSKIEIESKNVLSFWDIKPASPVHVLIIPKKHIILWGMLRIKIRKFLGRYRL